MSAIVKPAASRKSRGPATPPVPRPDRRFYSATSAFGRFGMRWFDPMVMTQAHSHGHIELNWLTDGGMRYQFDGRAVLIPSNRLIMFWAGIPHQTVDVDRGVERASRQCNIYLPLDTFLYMPKLGTLTETMMGGGIIALSAETIGVDTLHRWYDDYRSGDVERSDILKAEIGIMLRRAAVTGWDEIMPAWIETPAPSSRAATPLRYVVAMLRHIIENLDQPLSASDVAKVVDLHPNYALNLFSSVMQVPMHKFVLRMRIIKARAMLFEGNESIENVAFKSGFVSLSQFYLHFRQAYGVTPRQMRAS
jgi:AraC family transcriptional regulator, melibiose operon regulatory protein